MKKILLAAFVAVLALTSCNKENGLVSEGQTILVNLPNVTTRAVEGQVAPGTESTLSALNNAIFLLNGVSVVAVSEFDGTDITAGYKRLEQVPSSVNGVLVVANIPGSAADIAAVKALTTSTAIESYPFLATTQNGTAGVADKLMMGKDVALNSTATDPAPDGHTYKEATVLLRSVTARMEIGAVTEGTGIVPGSLELVSVWINNFYTNFSKTPATLQNYPSTDPVWPVITNIISPALLPNPSIPAYTPAVYQNNVSPLVDLTAGTQVYAYQVFAGNLPQVIMLVKGQFDTGYHDGTNEYFMQYVTFSKYTDDATTLAVTSFAGNSIYKIGVGTGGVVITPGILTPTPNTESFDLGINVSVAPWTIVNVTPAV